jgi:hypothetical protein
MPSADYGGAERCSRSREHAEGISQLTELASSGRLPRAAASGAGIGGAWRERLRRDQLPRRARRRRRQY